MPSISTRSANFPRILLSRADVVAFKAQWPASGLPDAPIWFEFDRSNGDLVDMGSSRSLARSEGTGAQVALSEDAERFAVASGVVADNIEQKYGDAGRELLWPVKTTQSRAKKSSPKRRPGRGSTPTSLRSMRS